MYLFLFYLATWTQDNDQNFALKSLHPTAVFKSDPDQQDSSASFCLRIHDAISYTNPSSRRIWHSYVLITEQFLLMMMVGGLLCSINSVIYQLPVVLWSFCWWTRTVGTKVSASLVLFSNLQPYSVAAVLEQCDWCLITFTLLCIRSLINGH